MRERRIEEGSRMNSLVSPPSGIMAWINQYGQVVFFFGQLIFWLGCLVFLGYAVWQYKRWVNFQLGVGHSGALRTDKPKETVSVEEFVE
jgi:hypothetical protein